MKSEKLSVSLSDIPESLQRDIIKLNEEGHSRDYIRKRLKTKMSLVSVVLGNELKFGDGSGRISQIEKAVIKQMVLEGKKDNEIAKIIRKNPKTIRKYRIENELVEPKDQDGNDHNEMVERLKSRGYWKQVKKILDKDELIIFQEDWIEYMLQFKEDVTATEESQIKQAILVDIYMYRNRINQQKNREQVQKYIDDIAAIYSLPPEERDAEKLAWLMDMKHVLESAQQSNTVEYTKLLDEHHDLLKALKSTRDQRLSRVDDSKTSWAGLVKYLEDEKNREREGLEAELMKTAVDLKMKELAQPHTYVDGQDDLPILSPETLEIYDKNKEKEEEDESFNNGG